eukprot:TRINITY_DN31070_c0_g1_i1.p1 TRINITY_DN31070_c0_g1~~TRINITY_DN31070_c0_g1_i1.p1  ORF type:complete len:605 (+),score=140.09 TRINITY_DN31070_c0_g1_i1:40-1854(+)
MNPSDIPSEYRDVFERCMEAGQSHLFDGWETRTTKIEFLKQLKEVHEGYPGGVVRYVENAKKLLSASKAGENPLEGYQPEVPAGGSGLRSLPDFDGIVKDGLNEIPKTAFVLVAGGLGERLGYSDIKIKIPIDTITETSFIETYISYILQWQKITNCDKPVPLAIMTSDDTNDKTVQFLEANNNFGMTPSQITILKQGKVPSLIDNDAKFAVDPADGLLLTKPHGHGDVHQLVYSSGLAEKWLSEGKKHILFFQDTHVLCMWKVLPTLGVSVREGFTMNSMTIPRKPGEASGSVCLLKANPDSGKQDLTINVEYNQLDPLLRSTLGHPDKGEGDEGYSPFPGNVNTFVISLPVYCNALKSSDGVVPEFVNPKYADSSRSTFKSPTRLECMMQDIPKFFPPTSRVGFTKFERHLYCPVKNATADGAAKQKGGQMPGCASYAEYLWSSNFVNLLKECDASVEVGEETEEWLGVTVPSGPRVFLSPSFAPTREILRSKVCELKISKRSQLCIRGGGGGKLKLKNIKLDGTLIIEVDDSCQNDVVLENLTITNLGWKRVPVPDSPDTPAGLRIRGYTTEKSDDATIIKINSSGNIHVSGVKSEQLSSL